MQYDAHHQQELQRMGSKNKDGHQPSGWAVGPTGVAERRMLYKGGRLRQINTQLVAGSIQQHTQGLAE